MSINKESKNIPVVTRRKPGNEGSFAKFEVLPERMKAESNALEDENYLIPGTLVNLLEISSVGRDEGDFILGNCMLDKMAISLPGMIIETTIISSKASLFDKPQMEGSHVRNIAGAALGEITNVISIAPPGDVFTQIEEGLLTVEVEFLLTGSINFKTGKMIVSPFYPRIRYARDEDGDDLNLHDPLLGELVQIINDSKVTGYTVFTRRGELLEKSNVLINP